MWAAYFMLTIPTSIVNIKTNQQLKILIKKGGGTGPVMPGNRLWQYCANSCERVCVQKIRRSHM